jgi:hypothetical protein
MYQHNWLARSAFYAYDSESLWALGLAIMDDGLLATTIIEPSTHTENFDISKLNAFRDSLMRGLPSWLLARFPSLVYSVR